MFNKKEILAIIISSVVLAFAVSLIKSLTIFSYALLAVISVLLINIFAKKIMSYYLDSKIEIKLWEIERYGFKPTQRFKKPFPAGAFFPVITSIISLGYFKWLASLIFDVRPRIYRASKRHGIYAFSEMTEFQIGLIASAGIFANLFFSIIGYLAGFPDFARLNIYYAFFNMIPISDLDGNKIFFGSRILWGTLAVIVLVALSYAFFLI
jgi:hypothetical protein